VTKNASRAEGKQAGTNVRRFGTRQARRTDPGNRIEIAGAVRYSEVPAASGFRALPAICVRINLAADEQP